MKKIHASHDRNLLFGVLAFQLDFVTQAQLIETMQAWMMRKEKSLGEVLVEKGFLTTQRRELLVRIYGCQAGRSGNRVRAAKRGPTQGHPAGLVSCASPDPNQNTTSTFSIVEPFEGREVIL